jgi:ankyrin repeat protein
LVIAVDSNQEPMARLLLDRGADPNHHGAGHTALHSAVQRAMPELVKALLARGADPNARLEDAMPLFPALFSSRTAWRSTNVARLRFGSQPITAT